MLMIFYSVVFGFHSLYFLYIACKFFGLWLEVLMGIIGGYSSCTSTPHIPHSCASTEHSREQMAGALPHGIRVCVCMHVRAGTRINCTGSKLIY